MELRDIQRLLGPDHPGYRAKQIYDAVYSQKTAELSKITTIPQSLRRELKSQCQVGLPELETRYTSATVS